MKAGEFFALVVIGLISAVTALFFRFVYYTTLAAKRLLFIIVMFIHHSLLGFIMIIFNLPMYLFTGDSKLDKVVDMGNRIEKTVRAYFFDGYE